MKKYEGAFMLKNKSGRAFLIRSGFHVTWDAFLWLVFIAFGLCVCSVCSALVLRVLRSHAPRPSVRAARGHCGSAISPGRHLWLSEYSAAVIHAGNGQ